MKKKNSGQLNEGMLDDPMFADLDPFYTSDDEPKDDQNLADLIPGVDPSMFDTDDSDNDDSDDNNDEKAPREKNQDRRNNQVIGKMTTKSPGSWDMMATSYRMDDQKLDNDLTQATSLYTDALKSLKYDCKPYDAESVINMMYLIMTKNPRIDYDIMALGSNINDTVYMKSTGQVLITFSHTQKVQYKGGPDERRKKVSMAFRPVVNALKKIAKTKYEMNADIHDEENGVDD